MLKGIIIWNRLSLLSEKLLLLVCFLLEFPLSILFFNKIYISFINTHPQITIVWQILLFILCIFSVGNILVQMAKKEMENFSLIEYWASLSYCECFTYITCKLLPWIELGQFFSLMFGIYNLVSPLMIILVSLSVDIFAIHIGLCRSKRSAHKRKPTKKITSKMPQIIHKPFIQLIWIFLCQRLRCMEVTFATIIMNILYIIINQITSGSLFFILSIIFTIFLLLVSDRYFESEGNSFLYYKSIGLSLKKYLFIQFCASILYSEFVIICLLPFNNMSVLRTGIYLLLLIWFIIYWNITYIYIENKYKQNNIAKFWFEFICFWISIFPIINLLWIRKMFLYIKRRWNYD